MPGQANKADGSTLGGNTWLEIILSGDTVWTYELPSWSTYVLFFHNYWFHNFSIIITIIFLNYCSFTIIYFSFNPRDFLLIFFQGVNQGPAAFNVD